MPDKYILSVAKEGPIAFYEKENCRHAIGPSFFIFKKERIEKRMEYRKLREVTIAFLVVETFAALAVIKGATELVLKLFYYY